MKHNFSLLTRKLSGVTLIWYLECNCSENVLLFSDYLSFMMIIIEQTMKTIVPALNQMQ